MGGLLLGGMMFRALFVLMLMSAFLPSESWAMVETSGMSGMDIMEARLVSRIAVVPGGIAANSPLPPLTRQVSSGLHFSDAVFSGLVRTPHVLRST